VKKTVLHACLVLLMLTLTAGAALATTYTIPAGSGKLSYTATVITKQCTLPPPIRGGGSVDIGQIGSTQDYYLSTYTSFSYTVSGTTTPLSGSDHSTSNGNDIQNGGCGPASSYPPVTLTGPGLEITFTPSGTTGGSASVVSGVTGFVNPKYVVVGVTYAPPGPSSNVTYTNSTFVGTTTTTTSSFTNDLGVTVSVSGGIGVWTILGGAGVKMTDTDSTDYIQGTNSSSTVTMSKQTGVSYKTNGTGNAFSPVNHDYDTIWLWLNPLFIYTVYPGTTNVQWNGYGYDPKDPSGTEGLDVFGVQVGYLNGDFGADPSITTILARGWVTTNEPGMIWPSGQGPGLTSADIANVLAADPFTSPSYTLPPLLPSTTADGRFTQEAYPPNPIEYAQAGLGNGGGLTTIYNAVYVDTQSVAQGTTNTFKQAVGTELAFTGGTWFNTWTLDIKTTDTLTWTNTWLNTLTTTNTLTDALSVTGPGCPQTSPPCVPAYAGPGQFVAFQDNQYGTFMFYPSN
jgi:hypothetical protein